MIFNDAELRPLCVNWIHRFAENRRSRSGTKIGNDDDLVCLCNNVPLSRDCHYRNSVETEREREDSGANRNTDYAGADASAGTDAGGDEMSTCVPVFDFVVR